LLIQTRGGTAVLTPPAPRRSRTGMALVVLVIIFCLGGTGLWAIMNLTEPEPTQTAIVADGSTPDNALPSPTLILTADGAVGSTTATPPAVASPTLGTIDIIAPANDTEFE